MAAQEKWITQMNAKKREYIKEWNKKHRANLEYRERERKQNREYVTRKRAKFPWLSHWWNAEQRCSNSNLHNYRNYGGRGIRFLLTQLEIKTLYERDHASRMEQPSIDRIDSNGDYCFENCRFIEKLENVRGGVNYA